MKRSWVLLSLVLPALLAGGCRRKSHEELATPKGAAKTWFAAVEHGDAELAKACVAIQNEEQSRYVDALVSAEAALNKLQEAAVARYGDAGKRIREGSETIVNVAQQIDAAEERVEGGSVTLSLKGEPRSIKLVKVDEDWKVDFASVAGTVDGRRIELLTALSSAAHEVAAQVAAGRFASVQEAHKAFGERVLTLPISADPATHGTKPKKKQDK